MSRAFLPDRVSLAVVDLIVFFFLMLTFNANRARSKWGPMAFYLRIILYIAWQYIIDKHEIIEGCRKSLQDPYTSRIANVINGQKLVGDFFKASYTISPLIRNVGVRSDDVRDEIVVAFDDNVLVKDYGWVDISAFQLSRRSST
uniref:Uncharacterized protein n=1 Tax=Moniliophthora roreri TaxID=221103 RepID=A0A0W0GAZ4_MONRR